MNKNQFALICLGLAILFVSPISKAQTTLKKEGFDGFLMGENFMKTVDPAAAFAAFVAELKKRENEN